MEVSPLLFLSIRCVSFSVLVLVVIFEASSGSLLSSRSCGTARFVTIPRTLVFILWSTMVILYFLSLFLLLYIGDFVCAWTTKMKMLTMYFFGGSGCWRQAVVAFSSPREALSHSTVALWPLSVEDHLFSLFSFLLCPRYRFCCHCLDFIVVFFPVSSGTMCARLLQSDGG